MKRASLLVLVALVPVVVACTASNGSQPAGGASGSTQQLTVKSMDAMKFDPATLTARAGQPIQLTLDNSGSALAHDFDITTGLPQPVTVIAQPGQKASLTFTVDKPGTYTYVCGQPGHEAAGMKGTLTVQ